MSSMLVGFAVMALLLAVVCLYAIREKRDVRFTLRSGRLLQLEFETARGPTPERRIRDNFTTVREPAQLSETPRRLPSE